MTFEKLAEELSAKLGVEIEDAGGAFALDVDGQTVILQLAGGRDGDILLMRADLGEIAPDQRDSLATAALEANWLYQGTGGATLAFNPNDEHLHLHRYDWLDRLDSDKALEALSRFAETAAAWRRIAAEMPVQKPAGEDGHDYPIRDNGDFMPV